MILLDDVVLKEDNFDIFVYGDHSSWCPGRVVFALIAQSMSPYLIANYFCFKPRPSPQLVSNFKKVLCILSPNDFTVMK